jgi:hypothetical protein
MARNENPPFDRGETFYQGDTIDTNNLGGVELEGMEWVFEDVHPRTGIKRTGRPVRCRIVRNVGAAALLPKRLCRFVLTSGLYGLRVDGYATTTAAEGYPLDEYLPDAGLAVNDLGWLVMDGPAVCLTPLADGSADLTVGNSVVAITGATSGATTSGRVENQVLTGATALLANQVQNRVGRAMTTRVTNSTNTDILVDVGHW